MEEYQEHGLSELDSGSKLRAALIPALESETMRPKFE